MPKYEVKIEYKPSITHKEEAMIDAEHRAFNAAIPNLRGKFFSSMHVSTYTQLIDTHADLAKAVCIISLTEA